MTFFLLFLQTAFYLLQSCFIKFLSHVFNVQPRKDTNTPLNDGEIEIIPTKVQPLGDVVSVKDDYEKALRPEEPPIPKRASAYLSREEWDSIREELLEESCNRNALR